MTTGNQQHRGFEMLGAVVAVIALGYVLGVQGVTAGHGADAGPIRYAAPAWDWSMEQLPSQLMIRPVTLDRDEPAAEF